MLIGQFQGRQHRFSCPVQMGSTYRMAYIRARGPRCFDHAFYLKMNMDLTFANLKTQETLWAHFAGFGLFEDKRRFRWGSRGEGGLGGGRAGGWNGATHRKSVSVGVVART